MSAPHGVVMYVPGSRWDDIRGTDYHLATAISGVERVLWVDPPLPLHHFSSRNGLSLRHPWAVTEVETGITVLRSLSIPFFTRRGFSRVAGKLQRMAIRSALKAVSAVPTATILSSPISEFPMKNSGVNVLYVTDDWLSGASMMGLSKRRIAGILDRNLASAKIVAAVSPYLAAAIAALAPAGAAVEVIPNGCRAATTESGPSVQRTRSAALIGQLNERLDMDVLEAVLSAGTPITVIGPRTDRDPRLGQRLDDFLASPSVTWLGTLPASDLGPHLAAAGVGLTPYADNEFNRSSFPLKTLDYLAAGIPVVATDLPAVQWLDTDLVSIGATAQEFSQKVQAVLEASPNPTRESDRKRFAAQHTWQARSAGLLKLIDDVFP